MSSQYPPLLTVPPLQSHKQSLILLHGRGSTGADFGLEFLKSTTSASQTLPEIFPHMKFVFPTAKKRRARAYNRTTIHQWFDNVPLDEQDRRGGCSREEEEWQIDGLRESRDFLQDVVGKEVQAVGARNVFIGGLSQGCAMTLHLLLSYDGDAPLGGFVGMSGWLPFIDEIEEVAQARQSREDDVFDVPDEQSEADSSAATKVCNFVRDNMDLPSIGKDAMFPDIPAFLGHGKSDDRVKISRGRKAANCLRELGVDVTWKEYDEGHWYKVPDEIDDIADFLINRIGDPEARS